MRPVKKKKIGESILLADGTSHVVMDEYKPYGKARKVLLANLGNYCSYCESAFGVYSNLQTEHVQPKGWDVDGIKPNAELSTKWENFLLGCATCNGSGNKGCKDINSDNIHLPHLNNTYLSLVYKEAGVVIPNPKLTGKSLAKAEELIKVLGLGKSFTDSDGRCEMRREKWDLASYYLEEYEEGEIKLKFLIDFIKLAGCWSIWFTVFKNHDEVRKALIEEFPGTASECFDEENHYNPIFRNPLNPDDPI